MKGQGWEESKEMKKTREKRAISLFEIAIMIISTFAFAFLIALATPSESGFGIAEIAAAQDVSFCCEKTLSGEFCQNAPETECDISNDFRATPSSCEATSFCKKGCCYDSKEGICSENTPQRVCDDAEGTWSDDAECNIPQCASGCCVIGTQAAFVSSVRCKSLSSFYGVNTDFGPTTETTCIEGGDEVYFVDTCGNRANIYDASKVNEKDYWTDIFTKSESCGAGSANANSASCGNCDYLAGSIWGKSEFGDTRATYGDNICQDLNCETTSLGESKKHGETWCFYDSETGDGKDAVGSRHYRHICISGEETTEACDDFRQQSCVQSAIETSTGESFSQAGCRVNRWQDCIAQIEQEDCENTDKRDCRWTASGESIQNGTIGCSPNVPPGLDFWNADSDANGICSAATKTCTAKFEKGLLDSDWKCKENCECLAEGWAQNQNSLCAGLGDCGGYVNYVGAYTDDGYEYTIDGEKRTLPETGSDVVTFTGKVITALASKVSGKMISGMTERIFT